MSRPTIETEELAQVVIAEEARSVQGRPWHITLRPWLFCLLFLVIAEGVTRYLVDFTPLFRHERLDNFPNTAAVDAFTRQIARDRAFRVVMIGDSVVVGPTLLKKDETIPRQLEAILQHRLPGRKIHVWNMSVVGLRSLDQYCMLKKVLEAKPDMVIVPANYFIIAQDTGEMPLNYPWLARSLPEVPEFLRREMPARGGKEAFEEGLTDLFERNIRLIGLRHAINACLFGIQPRSKTPNPLLMAGFTLSKQTGHMRMINWRERNYRWTVWSRVYTRPITPENRNALGYQHVFDEIRRSGVPAFVYLTPQNPYFMDLYLPRGEYLANRGILAKILQTAAAPYRDFSDAVPDRYFYDNDHLTGAGSRVLAERIADEVAPRITSLLAAQRGKPDPGNNVQQASARQSVP